MTLELIIKLENLISEKIDPKTIGKYINYVITGNSNSNPELELILKCDMPIDSEGNCHLKENYVLINHILKMISEHPIEQEQEQLIDPIPSFNINFKNQKNYNRNGLRFLYSSLQPFSNNKSEILLDLYIDETFGINYDLYKILKIVPYTKNWYGFIHHTFDSICDYNCNTLFRNEDFILSLEHCKGLFVFSNNLKNHLDHILLKRKFNISVNVLCFPVPNPEFGMKFNIKNFKNNIKIVNIGSWLRNIYSFYKVNVQLKSYDIFKSKISKIQIPKYILNPKLSDIPSKNLLTNLGKTNHWEENMLFDIFRTINTVKHLIIENENGYNKLLSESIVFINVLGASGLSTLNNCIARNTPVIINFHPAVFELLGKDYPLYYSGENELVLTMKQIRKAHKYLIKLNKTKLNTNTFLCTLNKYITV
jgi:hypothetical protein